MFLESRYLCLTFTILSSSELRLISFRFTTYLRPVRSCTSDVCDLLRNAKNYCLFLYRRRARIPCFFHTGGDQSDENDYDGDNEEGNVENDEDVKTLRRLTTVGSVFASISQNGTSIQPDMRYGLQHSPSPMTISYTKIRAHRTTQRATTNQNPRTSRRCSTFGLPSDSESDVDEPPIDPESEPSSRSVI